MERIKVLTAAVALGTFTVDELVAFSGVKRSTVRSVLGRNPKIVEQLGSEAPEKPGRPSSKWTVKDSEATREFVASIDALDPRPTSVADNKLSPNRIDDQYDAAVSVAENMLSKIANRDPAIQRRIVRSAQATLNLVDGDAQTPLSGNVAPWWVNNDSPAATRARAVDALAELAVTPEGDLGDELLFDTAHRVAEALAVAPERGESLYFAPFTQILAGRGALSPLMMVVADAPPGLPLDEWTELPDQEIEPTARVFTQRWATPLVGVAESMPLVLLTGGANVNEGFPPTAAQIARWLERSRTYATPVLVLGDAGQADMARLAARYGAPFVPADNWESPETVTLAAEALSSIVERHATQTVTDHRLLEHLLDTITEHATHGTAYFDSILAQYESVGGAALTETEPASPNVVRIKPVDDQIIVHTQGDAIVTTSGPVADTGAQQHQRGTVVAAGPGRRDEDSGRRIPLKINEGDTVIYRKQDGTEIKYNGDEMIILNARDIVVAFLHHLPEKTIHGRLRNRRKTTELRGKPTPRSR